VSSLNLKDGMYRLRMSEDIMLRRIFGPKEQEQK
jgi:hypothetical protein